MATHTVQITGDSSDIVLRCTNLSGSEMSVISGSFRGTADDRRVVSAFFDIGGTKTLEVRFEFIDPVFVETTVTGQPIHEASDIHRMEYANIGA